MSVQISNKKQFLVLTLFILIWLGALEITAYLWTAEAKTCDFIENELFDTLKPEIKEKLCNDLQNIRMTDEYIPHNEVQDNQSIIINSEGLRGPEFEPQKPLDEFRIIIVGGSTAFGAGSTSDQTTIPGFLETKLNEQFEFEIKVLNAGVGGQYSIDELKMIKEKLIHYEPDLLIVYDGWNDLRRVISLNQIQSNWNQMCSVGNNNNFDVWIVLQPLAGFGHKVLSQQEFSNFLLSKDFNGNQLDPTYYEKYWKSLIEIREQCSGVFDFRGVFDDISEPIYFDEGHMSDVGNNIIANEMSILVTESIDEIKNDSLIENQSVVNIEISEDDIFLEKINLKIEDLISYYKTPIMVKHVVASISNQANYFSVSSENEINKDFLQNPFKNYDGSKKYFKKWNLDNQDFENSKFIGTIFDLANMDNTNFKNSTVTNSTFIGTSIKNSFFEDTNLDNVIFDSADLSGTKFIRSSLIGTNFQNSNLENVYFEDVIFEDNNLNCINHEICK